MTSSTEEKIVISFATECFRNVADKDYISARMIYRLGLMEQFQWLALQAIKKYLKSILLYNLRCAKGLNHDLEEALKQVEEIDYLEFDLSEEGRKFITHLNQNAQNRYLEQPSRTLGDELLLLDHTVWSIRRYCKVINYEIASQGENINMLQYELEQIKSDYYKNNPHKFSLIGGYLEEVIKREKSDPERKALVWKNFYFGLRKKQKIKNFTCQLHSVNPPHFRDIRRYEILKRYVHFLWRIRKILEQN